MINFAKRQAVANRRLVVLFSGRKGCGDHLAPISNALVSV